MRRMINTKVADLDMFIDMPATSRLLYYDLLIRADDDGFITPKRVMRMTGASDNDLGVLKLKGFIYAWDDGVVVLLHWREHNHVKGDRYTPSDFYPRLRDIKGSYALGARQDGTNVVPKRIQSGSKSVPQDRIGKDRVGEVRIEQITTPLTPRGEVVVLAKSGEAVLDYWEEVIAPITTTRETQRKASVVLQDRYGLETCQKMIRVVAHAHSNRYASKEVKCQSLHSLMDNWDKVVIYAKSQAAEKAKNIIKGL